MIKNPTAQPGGGIFPFINFIPIKKDLFPIEGNRSFPSLVTNH